MHTNTLRTAIGALAAVALALPTAASAHPGIYSVDALLAKAPEVQTITVDATAGMFKPSAGATAVAFDAPTWAVQAALEADPAIGVDSNGNSNVLVVSPSAGQYVLTFQGATKNTINVPTVVPVDVTLTGAGDSVTAMESTPGGGAAIVYPAPTGTLAVQTQYTIANDGYAIGIREGNGVAIDGMLNLKLNPGTYRTPETRTQWIQEPTSQTGLQPHATCQGIPALASATNVDAWQATPSDPFYNYIPFQSAAAGLGDSPAKWIPVVKSVTSVLPGAPVGGIDLSTLTTKAQLASACSAIGGTFRPSDIISVIGGNAITDAETAAKAPLNAQVATLTAQVASLTSAKATTEAALATANAALTEAQAKVLALTRRSVEVTLASAKFTRGIGTMMVTGTAGAKVTVSVMLTKAQAASIGLKSTTFATTTRTFDKQGASLITIAPSKAVAKAYAKQQPNLKVIVTVTSGTTKDTVRATLVH